MNKWIEKSQRKERKFWIIFCSEWCPCFRTTCFVAYSKKKKNKFGKNKQASFSLRSLQVVPPWFKRDLDLPRKQQWKTISPTPWWKNHWFTHIRILLFLVQFVFFFLSLVWLLHTDSEKETDKSDGSSTGFWAPVMQIGCDTPLVSNVATAADSCSSRSSFEGNNATIGFHVSSFTAAGKTSLRVRRTIFKKASREQRVTARVKPLIWTISKQSSGWTLLRFVSVPTQSAVVAFGKTSWCRKWKFVPQLFTCVS